METWALLILLGIGGLVTHVPLKLSYIASILRKYMKVYASICKFMQVYCKITKDENIQLLFLEGDPIYVVP